MKTLTVRESKWFFVFGISGALLITWLFISSVRDSLRQFAEQMSVDEYKVSHILKEGVDQYIFGLQGANGVMVVQNFNPTQKDFRNYAVSRNFFNNFPGALGFGFIRAVPSIHFANYRQKQKKNFKVHPEVDTNLHMIIEHIQPLEANKAALGLDVAFENNRKEAALFSVKTGKPTLTKKINLVQQKTSQSGFLFFLPLFRTLTPPSSEQERLRELVGWAYSPIVLETLFTEIAQGIPKDVEVIVEIDGAETPLIQGQKKQKHYPYLKNRISSLLTIGEREWKVTITADAKNAVQSLLILSLIYAVVLLILFASLYLIYRAYASKENFLREKTKWMDALVQSVGYSVISTRPDGVILTFNPSAEKMLGYRAEEMIGLQTPAIIHEASEVAARAAALTKELGYEVKPGFESFVAKARLGVSDENEWTYVRKDGTRFPVILNVTSIRNDDNSIIGFLGVAHDTTEKKRLIHDLIQSKESALAAAKTKSEFIANISHEIRTPLNGILGITVLLLDHSKDPHTIEQLKTLQQCGDVLLKLINNILDFSKLEANKLALDRKPFNLLTVYSETCNLFRFQAQKNGINLESKLDINTSKWFLGDAMCVREILTNLIANALKFTESGTISISSEITPLKGKEHRIQFSVKDTGIGISPEEQTKLFQPFSQLDASATRRFGGSGLGLAISKELCEKMGGRIWVESKIDEGSIFSFYIVAEETVPNEKTAVHVKSFDHHLGTEHPLRILVAEDNKTNEIIISSFLGKLGYKADTCVNGIEVLNRLQNTSYDLILMDCHMPKMDGFEATRRIFETHEKSKRPRIVALTASALKDDYDRCIECGMDDFISKPISLSQLAKILKETKQISAH